MASIISEKVIFLLVEKFLLRIFVFSSRRLGFILTIGFALVLPVDYASAPSSETAFFGADLAKARIATDDDGSIMNEFAAN